MFTLNGSGHGLISPRAVLKDSRARDSVTDEHSDYVEPPAETASTAGDEICEVFYTSSLNSAQNRWMTGDVSKNQQQLWFTLRTRVEVDSKLG